jgi:hypothetical protein
MSFLSNEAVIDKNNSGIIQLPLSVPSKNMEPTTTTMVQDTKKQKVPESAPFAYRTTFPAITAIEPGTGDEQPPRRFVESKRLFLQNIDKEQPNGRPPNRAPNKRELKGQIAFRDTDGRGYAYVSNIEGSYLTGWIESLLVEHAQGDPDAKFMFVVLPPVSMMTVTMESVKIGYPEQGSKLQLINTMKLQNNKTGESFDKGTAKATATVIWCGSNGPAAGPGLRIRGTGSVIIKLSTIERTVANITTAAAATKGVATNTTTSASVRGLQRQKKMKMKMITKDE